jgi:hypothetical protein
MAGCFGAGRRSWGIIGGRIKVHDARFPFLIRRVMRSDANVCTEAVAAGVIPSNAASINRGACDGF